MLEVIIIILQIITIYVLIKDKKPDVETPPQIADDKGSFHISRKKSLGEKILSSISQ